MNYTLHYLLMADHIMLQKRLLADIKELDLTLGQPKVLDYLKDNNGAVQKDIAKGCHIEPASLSTVLAGMERKGLIIRNMCDGNRRNLNVFMTGKGKEMCERIDKQFAVIEEKATYGLSDDEIAQLNKYLTKIHDNLEVL